MRTALATRRIDLSVATLIEFRTSFTYASAMAASLTSASGTALVEAIGRTSSAPVSASLTSLLPQCSTSAQRHRLHSSVIDTSTAPPRSIHTQSFNDTQRLSQRSHHHQSQASASAATASNQCLQCRIMQSTRSMSTQSLSAPAMQRRSTHQMTTQTSSLVSQSASSHSHLQHDWQCRHLHASRPPQSSLIVGLVVTGALAYGATRMYKSAKAWRPDQQVQSGASDPHKLATDSESAAAADSRFYAGGFEDKMDAS